MQKIKTKKKIALSILLASAVAVGGAAIALGTSQEAFAADYTQTLDGTKVFYTGIRGAEITYSPVEMVGENAHAYTMFKIAEEQTVEYRQNLAYSWRTGAAAEDHVTFSMEIGFTNTDFERYVIRFQSQQYVLTEDKITENYIVFTPNATGDKLNMSVVQELEDDTRLDAVAQFSTGEHIEITFGQFNDGEYPIIVNGTDVARFKNVYESYATYVSSGDNAVTPLTFSATFAEGQQDNTADMVLYDINGQSFELLNTKEGDNGSTEYEIKVTDNAAPVMCFTDTPSYLIDGDSIGFSYKVIDVLGTSTRATAYYYVLSGDQYADADFDYDKYDYSGEGENSSDNPFIEITSASSIRIIRDENTFIPSSMLDDNVYGLVKIYYKIADRSGDNANSDVIFADWYAKDEALVDVQDIKHSGPSSKFLKLIDETEHKPGLTYAQESNLTATDTSVEDDPVLYAYKQTIRQFQEAYQKKINAAIAALDDGKLYAGTDSKFYLPSFDNLTDESGNPIDFDLADTDDYLYKGDYKYSIFYKAKTSGKASSLSANALSISLTEADVSYRFTIFITDSFGNNMRYPTLDNGEIVWETISSDDVWDEDYAELLPFFEFYVSYKEATATPPETLSIAYVNTSYSGVSFTIKGVSGTYTAKYNLYVVDRDGLNDELKVKYNDDNFAYDYDSFKEDVDDLFNDAQTRKYFKTVKPVSNLLETDENYEEFKELNWNDSSVSFTPTSVNDYYVIRLTLQDNNSKQTEYQYAVVSASVETTSLKGEDNWIGENSTSVILFTVAGVFLIALVVLLIVKPKDKGDIDKVYTEEIEKEKGKKNKTKKKGN